jgi:hypothetical protein
MRKKLIFGYATSVAADGRYLGLSFGDPSSVLYIDAAAVLVKPEAARLQLEAEAAAPPAPSPYTPEVTPVGLPMGDGQGEGYAPTATPPASAPPVSPPTAVLRRFHGAVSVDATRLSRDADRIALEVVQHLAGLDGAEVEVTIEIQARLREGAPDQVVRTVAENCRTLKFESFGFEES